MPTYTSNDTYTPSDPGVVSVEIETQGDGGGGGGGDGSSGSGGGGGAGGNATTSGYPVTYGDSYGVTVGQGGAGGATFNDGSSGTGSDFNGVCSASGGGGGQNGNASGNPGSGGTGSGTVNHTGGDGLSGGSGGTGGEHARSNSDGSNGGGSGQPGDGGNGSAGNGSDGAAGYVSIVENGVAPSTPTGLGATGGLSAHVPLSWSPASLASGYRLYRDTSSGGSFSTMVYDGGSTSFDDTGLTNGVTYYYKVSAYNTFGESSLSSSVNATPLSASTTFDRSLTITLSMSDGVTGLHSFVPVLTSNISIAQVLTLGYGKAITDSLSIIQTTTASKVINASLTSTIALIDSDTGIRAKIRSITDTLVITQSVFDTFTKDIVQTLTITDSVTTANNTPAESLLCLDSDVDIELVLRRPITDILALHSFAIGTLNNRIINKNYNLTHRKMKLLSNIYNVDVESVVTLTDHSSTPRWSGESELSLTDMAIGSVDRCQN